MTRIHFTDKDSSGEWGVRWALLPAGSTYDDVHALWWSQGLDPDRTWCQHEYDCCGHIYHGAVRISRSTSTRVLAVQHWHRNI